MGEATGWRAWALTVFPEMFPGPLGHSLAGKALKAGLWRVETVDIRDFARNKHRSVDEAPFGGGPGLVMRPEVVAAAVDEATPADARRLYLSPRGRLLDQALVRELAGTPDASSQDVVLLCGRFEGVDQRVLDARGFEEVRVADAVLSGGEVAALTLIDAVVRLLPGVMGAAASADDESFARGLLEYPHFTRPREWEGRPVPETLLSGDHARIEAWRQAEAERITRDRRPDLWAAYNGPTDGSGD